MTESEEASRLRDAAESRLKAAIVPCLSGAEGVDADLRRLVHELQAHKIELEMQNSGLRQSRAECEAALARYAGLYDFAPAGYATETTLVVRCLPTAIAGGECPQEVIIALTDILVCKGVDAGFHEAIRTKTVFFPADFGERRAFMPLTIPSPMQMDDTETTVPTPLH